MPLLLHALMERTGIASPVTFFQLIRPYGHTDCQLVRYFSCRVHFVPVGYADCRRRTAA